MPEATKPGALAMLVRKYDNTGNAAAELRALRNAWADGFLAGIEAAATKAEKTSFVDDGGGTIEGKIGRAIRSINAGTRKSKSDA